jgi:hypothetical protein
VSSLGKHRVVGTTLPATLPGTSASMLHLRLAMPQLLRKNDRKKDALEACESLAEAPRWPKYVAEVAAAALKRLSEKK